MSVIQLADMKAHLNVTFDTDDTLIKARSTRRRVGSPPLPGRFGHRRLIPCPVRCLKPSASLARTSMRTAKRL